MVTVPFGEWAPDLSPLGNPGTPTAKNVIPFSGGYLPFKNIALQTNALDDRVRGAFAARDASNNVYYYAGTETKLYELVAATFNDESGAAYSTATDDNWEFALYKAQVVATNYADPVQEIAIGGGGSGAFADLFTSTLKPKARHCATVGRFLVLGGTNDGTDGEQPARVWWSAIDDITDMDPSATTQCDFNDFADGGWVRKIVGGVEYGVVFQERQIWRMTYVGSPLVFDFQPVDRTRGTQIPGSVIAHGRLIFYISEDGFYGFDGQSSTPIGHNKVDRTFWDQFDITNKRFVSSAIDPLNKLVLWSFPGAGSTGGTPNKIFIYNWADNKWAEVDGVGNLDIVTSAVTQGYTLDGLDTVGTDIDDSSLFPVSFDSEFWKGGARRLAAFDSAHKLGYFTGSNLAMTVDTAEAQLISGQRAMVTAVRPLIDGGTPTIRMGSRNRQIDDVTFSASVTVNSSGLCPVRTNARYHRARLEVPASNSWSIAQGIDVPLEHIRPMGSR